MLLYVLFAVIVGYVDGHDVLDSGEDNSELDDENDTKKDNKKGMTGLDVHNIEENEHKGDEDFDIVDDKDNDDNNKDEKLNVYAKD
ncbi:hypothetical protein EWB00_009342, partial [Schistosoma japonicum]